MAGKALVALHVFDLIVAGLCKAGSTNHCQFYEA